MEAKDTTIQPIRLDIVGPKGEIIQTAEFVKEKIVLGRILSADMRIDDPRVSRIHALMEIRGADILLTDLASSHGTYVNGQKVVEQRLKFGDLIKLGFVEVKISKGSGQATPFPTHIPGKTLFEGEETLVNVDRRKVDGEQRKDSTDRRKRDAFPDENRLNERRSGDRRIEQRSGDDRRKGQEPNFPDGVNTERRAGDERRKPRDFERRIGDRRRGDRRVFDITSLERRIEDRRTRRGDDDLLPDELEKCFTAPDHARELELTVLWGDHILDVSNYYDPQVVTVGESPKNNHIIPSVGIGDEFPLVTIEEDGNAHFAFTGEMKGTVRAREKIYKIADLKNEKFVRRDGEYYVLPMKQDDFAKLAIGDVNFFMFYVKPAPRVKSAPMFDKDPLLVRTIVGSILLLILLAMGSTLVPKPKPVTIEMIPERFAKIVIRPRPKIPPATPAKSGDENKTGIKIPGMDEVQGGSKAGEGGPAIGEEGRAGKQNLPKGEVPQMVLPKSQPPKDATPSALPSTSKVATGKKATPTRERKVIDKAKSVGLLKAFGDSGVQNELRSIIDKGVGPEGPGGFDEFGKAVKGARGNSIEETGGAGGMGFKGVGPGGGGKTVGIDGPSTKGLGRGYKGSGIGEGIDGPGRFGMKGEAAISIANENVQVLSGLSKDIINSIVKQHQAEIRACYDSALQRNPGLRGKITIAFTIQPNGVVSYAGVKESTVGDRGLENCIITRTKTWLFPKPEAPVVTEVSAYPFFLNPAK